MELPYGTMTDEEMLKLPVLQLQDSGYLFLWVTGRAMELGRECMVAWGYERVEELVWVKTNQVQVRANIRTVSVSISPSPVSACSEQVALATGLTTARSTVSLASRARSSLSLPVSTATLWLRHLERRRASLRSSTRSLSGSHRTRGASVCSLNSIFCAMI